MINTLHFVKKNLFIMKILPDSHISNMTKMYFTLSYVYTEKLKLT